MENSEQNPLLEKPKFNLKKILVIGIIIVIIIAIVILMGFIKNSREKSGKEFSKSSLEEKLKLCLEKKEFDKNCKMLFINPDIDKECEKLEDKDLRDKCFYEIALADYNNLYCAGIQNGKLKEDCEIKTIKSEDYGLQ